jgi:hypothetical protein
LNPDDSTRIGNKSNKASGGSDTSTSEISHTGELCRLLEKRNAVARTIHIRSRETRADNQLKKS